jgi:hypothetical protein
VAASPRLIQGLKPLYISDALRGAEAPLFHATARVPSYCTSPELLP